MPSPIGHIIDDLRLKAGFNTLGQLHKASGVTTATLSRIINNIQKPTTETLKKLAPCLGITHEYLLKKVGYLESNTDTASPQPPKPKDLIKFLDQSEVMFDGIPLDDDDKERVKKSLEILFGDAKQKNKRKKS